jgi:predicted transposase YbfD/YdcC
MPKFKKSSIKFIEALESLPDTRDNRGKRHSQAFVITVVVMAILSGRSRVSSIQRYIENQIDWLRKVTRFHDAEPVSRTHLPRMLKKVNWNELNALITECFNNEIVQSTKDEWKAVDGKFLKGTPKNAEKQAVIHAVAHESRIDVAQAKQVGNKSSEITTVRNFLKESGLESQKITLDAHHCYAETMSQMQNAGGTYLIQVKENQPKLLEHCRNVSLQSSIAELIENDLGHGRISSHKSNLYPLSVADIDERWQTSGMCFLVVVNRETIKKSNGKQTQEISYYLSNYNDSSCTDVCAELTTAVRKHWGVESNNWQHDVTFNEDNVRVSDENQAQILSKFRTFAMNLLRIQKKDAHNFQALIEKFTDIPNSLVAMLCQVSFL